MPLPPLSPLSPPNPFQIPLNPTRCYDTCTDKGILTTPTCLIEPLPEPTEAQALALDHWRNLSHQREDFRPDVCDQGGKPWMCKPHDW